MDNSGDNRFATLIRSLLEDRADVERRPESRWDAWTMPIPVAVDVVLSETRTIAVMRLAHATAVRYPWIDMSPARAYCMTDRQSALEMARRTHDDTEGIDLLWRLCAAYVGRPLTFGFVDRLNAFADELVYYAPENTYAPLQAFKDRIDRLDEVREVDFNTPISVFSAMSEHGIARIREQLTARKRSEREKADERKKSTLGDLVADARTLGDETDALEAGRIRIIAADVKCAGAVKRLADEGARVGICADAGEVRDRLRAEFTHATAAVDLLTADLRSGEPVRIRPVILVGPPGCGKSRMVRALARAAGVPVRAYDCGSAFDSSFGGTSKQWSTARPSFPLTTVAETCYANPIVLLDEIEKAGTSNHNGNLGASLLGFTERETARAYPDVGIESPADLSHVCYVATANDDAHLPSPLRDRFRIVRVPAAGIEQLPDLCRSIVAELADDAGISPAFVEPLAPDELDVIARAWGDDRSIRTLQRLVRGTLAARDACASRN